MILLFATSLAAQDAPPRALTQAIPEHPKKLKEQRIVGSATIMCRITETGDVTEATITQASRKEFGDSALAAVARWKYQPAVRAGQPYAVKVSLPIEFALSEKDLEELENNRTKEILPAGPPTVSFEEADEPPQLRKEIRPDTPKLLRQARQMGQVSMAFIVDESGVPRDIHPVVTTHAECVDEAVAVIRKWRFTPGKKEGADVRVTMQVVLVFFPEDFWANGLRAKPGVKLDITENERKSTVAAQRSAGDRYVHPRVVKRRAPDFPGEMEDRGQSGKVTVEFIINERGLVTHVKITGSTNAFFTTVVEQAVSYWEFMPGTRNGVPVKTYVVQQMAFNYKR